MGSWNVVIEETLCEIMEFLVVADTEEEAQEKALWLVQKERFARSSQLSIIESVEIPSE